MTTTPNSSADRSLPRVAWEACNAAAAAEGLEAPLVRAICWVESRGNPMAVSPAGARGLMQIMPATGEAMGLRDPFDATQNARVGAHYFASLLKRYGVPSDALAAYNWGPSKVDRMLAGKIALPKSVALYATQVLSRWEVEKGFTGPFQAALPRQQRPSPPMSGLSSRARRSPPPLPSRPGGGKAKT